MKTIQYFIFIIGFTCLGQIKGNSIIETRSFPITGIETVKSNLYAKITIDNTAEESLSITADTNLFEHIGKTVENGTLHIDQLKWISPSQNIIIKIGAPNLKRLEQGTHDMTQIINLNNDYLQVMAPIGNIKINGKTKELRLGAELATIDASKVLADNVYVNLWSHGKIMINPQNSLSAKVTDSGRLVYINKPKVFDVKTKRDGKVLSIEAEMDLGQTKPEYINFRIKNNSSNRHQFYVVGPKSDGSKFSYGFPMMPNAKRKENWTVGTKVYKVNRLGFRKLLIKITKEDEGETVNLFKY